jgi:hypothetical protein
MQDIWQVFTLFLHKKHFIRLRWKDFLNFSDSEKKIVHVDHVFVQSRCNEQSLICRGQIDASYQVSVHLAKRFQRRRFLEIDNSCKSNYHTISNS